MFLEILIYFYFYFFFFEENEDLGFLDVQEEIKINEK